MIVVTERAAEWLKETLDEHATETEQLLRLVLTESGDFALMLDVEREGDEVVEREGTKLLSCEASIAPTVDGATLDCVDTPEGPRLTIYR